MMNNIHSILMVRPSSFRMNPETAKNNYFQKHTDLTDLQVLENACFEFDNLVNQLRSHGIPVNVFQDDLVHDTPDSVFPNNWISFHSNYRIAIYPMYANNRRLERNDKILKFLESKGVKIDFINDYSNAENHNLFLEGTGSMVLDRLNKKSYCSLSERTSENLIEEFCDEFNYLPIIFKSYQSTNNQRKPIYHTNVMMCIANNYSIICLDSIDSEIDKQIVVKSLKDDNKEIIEISEIQLNSFAGNMIELLYKNISFLIISSQAYKSLSELQIQKIEKFSKIIQSNVETIESCGGGSVRCMIAEVFN